MVTEIISKYIINECMYAFDLLNSFKVSQMDILLIQSVASVLSS